MKKLISVFIALALCFAPIAFATEETEVTPNGVNQGTLVRILKVVQTLVNELAADHDADNNAVAELITDHDADNANDAVLDGWETLIEELAADHDADNANDATFANWESMIEELAADHDADNANDATFANWESMIEEIATDHDADNTVADGYKTALDELMADHDADNNVIDDLKTLANGLRTYLNDGALAHGTLLITAAPEKFKTTTTAIYTISGVAYAKAAEDNLVFSAADTINTASGAGDFWGIWLVQVNAAGVISTKSPAADQTYATEGAAIAALPTADAANVAIGYITVEANNGADWVANTDDMTAASDCQAANFYNVTVKTIPVAVASSPAADLAAAAVGSFAADLAAGVALTTIATAADLAAGTTLTTIATAADLAAGTTVSSVNMAADLTANTQAADLSSDSTLGSGTYLDPAVNLTD